MEEFYNARNGPGSGVKNTSLAVLGKKLTNRCPPSLADHPEVWAQMQKTGQPGQLPWYGRPVPFVLSCRYCGWEPSDALARARGPEDALRRHWQREHWNPKVKCQVSKAGAPFPRPCPDKACGFQETTKHQTLYHHLREVDEETNAFEKHDPIALLQAGTDVCRYWGDACPTVQGFKISTWLVKRKYIIAKRQPVRYQQRPLSKKEKEEKARESEQQASRPKLGRPKTEGLKPSFQTPLNPKAQALSDKRRNKPSSPSKLLKAMKIYDPSSVPAKRPRGRPPKAKKQTKECRVSKERLNAAKNLEQEKVYKDVPGMEQTINGIMSRRETTHQSRWTSSVMQEPRRTSSQILPASQESIIPGTEQTGVTPVKTGAEQAQAAQFWDSL